MNTFEQIFILNDKLYKVMNTNKGVVRIVFFDNRQITIRILSVNTNYNFNDKTYKSSMITFIDNINDTTEYDMSTIKDFN
jgi:hypothetical protein